MGKRRLLIALSGVFLFVILLQVFSGFIYAGIQRIIVLWPNPDISLPNLQLRTFPYITVAPFPTTSVTPGIKKGPYCALDDVKPSPDSCRCLDFESIACPAPGGISSDCPKGQFVMPLPPGERDPKWYCIELIGPGLTAETFPTPPPGCFAACVAKPIVYLYPTEPTSVSVAVEAPGEVFVSDPLYPEGGWKDVLAYPDGTLSYQGKMYTELFYETSLTKKIPMPEEGIVMASKDIKEVLESAITKFGLVGREKDEFLEYWVPTLQKLHSPYIFFSILTPEVKDSVDRLVISPEPDTRIELIAYFKPLLQPIRVRPLSLPSNPPQRIGFTEVEWGGSIAY